MPPPSAQLPQPVARFSVAGYGIGSGWDVRGSDDRREQARAEVPIVAISQCGVWRWNELCGWVRGGRREREKAAQGRSVLVGSDGSDKEFKLIPILLLPFAVAQSSQHYPLQFPFPRTRGRNKIPEVISYDFGMVTERCRKPAERESYKSTRRWNMCQVVCSTPSSGMALASQPQYELRICSFTFNIVCNAVVIKLVEIILPARFKCPRRVCSAWLENAGELLWSPIFMLGIIATKFAWELLPARSEGSFAFAFPGRRLAVRKCPPAADACMEAHYVCKIIGVLKYEAVSLLASHKGDPGSIPGRVTLDFPMWELCRTMPLVGGFSRGSPVSPPFHSGAAPCSPSSALKTFTKLPIYLCGKTNWPASSAVIIYLPKFTACSLSVL
ncbi:hypothetical protein PR048_028331 [Dryococelus australis]|uniref:Uncharacterized protein n=1 Tax=Dryococelus australis TaxID=614101 RepID=A0ABQ9GIZ5_9NEOP|nr:hypothetical protein PR048_028331 [Dryococelus australis]